MTKLGENAIQKVVMDILEKNETNIKFILKVIMCILSYAHNNFQDIKYC